MKTPPVPVARPGEGRAVVAVDNSSPIAGQAQQPHAPMTPRWLVWLEAHPGTVIVGLVAVILLPLIAKPFHIDDPMYLWAGRHIVEHPLDFYGLNVFWTGAVAPMWLLNQNPPLTSYFIALVTILVAGSEVALHGAFLLPATLALVGTWQCARLYTRWPVLATVLTGLTPVFALCGHHHHGRHDHAQFLGLGRCALGNGASVTSVGMAVGRGPPGRLRHTDQIPVDQPAAATLSGGGRATRAGALSPGDGARLWFQGHF